MKETCPRRGKQSSVSESVNVRQPSPKEVENVNVPLFYVCAREAIYERGAITVERNEDFQHLFLYSLIRL